MTVQIDLSVELQEWVDRKLATGQFASPAEFIQNQLCQDWLEEKIGEALHEPATPVTSEDWAAARRRLDERISRGE